ncbi:MAG: heme-binding protein [Melioribacteraceae bacterium]|nr:heme-binding protein [Melioribacteraceae bacterium]
MKSFVQTTFLITLFYLLLSTGEIMAYEEPEYKVIGEYDEFEIREYSSYLVAETVIDSTFEDAGSAAFNILFDYISGGNIKKEEIEMTIPVNQSKPKLEGERN